MFLVNNPSSAQVDSIDINLQLGTMRQKRRLFQDQIQRRMAALGISEMANLQTLSRSKFLQLRMNARALKLRLRQRLCERKFELEQLEKSYNNTVNGMFVHS